MERDRDEGEQTAIGSSAVLGRETAATRRLREFLIAADSFDHRLSEGEFDSLFEAIAPSKTAEIPSNHPVRDDWHVAERPIS